MPEAYIKTGVADVDYTIGDEHPGLLFYTCSCDTFFLVEDEVKTLYEFLKTKLEEN